MIELGGNITLSGFKELDRDTMIIVKKIIGSYIKKYTEKDDKFQSFSVNLKTVHETENSAIYEVKGNLIGKKQYNAEVNDRNLMIAIDKLLKKLDSTIEE
jgi:ribosome-associated translation inhibitor RaiA